MRFSKEYRIDSAAQKLKELNQRPQNSLVELLAEAQLGKPTQHRRFGIGLRYEHASFGACRLGPNFLAADVSRG
jgi:hypothetical protein